MNKVIKVAIKDLRKSERILSFRPLDRATVSRYRQAWRCGECFPPIIVDQNYVIISGYHRTESARLEFGGDWEIDVIVMHFHDEVSRVEKAIEENRHGLPIVGFSRRSAILVLQELGRNPQQIGKLFKIHPKQVVDMAGMSVVVLGEESMRPIKRGLEHLAGSVMSAEQYEVHRKADRGISVVTAANQILRWFENGWVELDDRQTRESMENLARVLEEELQ
jgi:hypothetical protein